MFLDEACVSGGVVADQAWYNFFKAQPSYTPSEVFARPWLADTLTWNDGVVVQNIRQLSQASIVANPLWNAHLAGRALFRATWVVRVEVSNSPFMGGILRLSHAPYTYFNRPSTFDNSVSRLRQLPGVDLDISNFTSAVFKIPHRSLEPWLYLQSATNPQHNGYFVLWARTRLNLGDGSPPKISVWLSFEDVEIAGDAIPAASRGTLVPQSGALATAKRTREYVAERDSQSGPLSKFLEAGATVLTTYGEKIPLLSAYASPLSWAARMSAKVAAAFGFSRPLDQRAVQVHRRHQWGTFNSTGVETAYVMALGHDTQVPPAPITGQKLDQMSVAFLAQQLFPLIEVRVPDTTPAQKLLCSGVLSPYGMLRHPSPGNSCPPLIDYRYNLMTPASGSVGISAFVPSAPLWLSSWFTYWRGSIRFRLLFGKTKLHGGRFLFLWDYFPQGRYVQTVVGGPYAVPSANILLPADLQTAHADNKVIIDIRESADVEIVVPYVAPMPMWPVIGGIGSWGLYMLDPLNHPASTAAYVDVAIEASFTEDFQVAGLRASPFWPDDTMSPMVAQAGFDASDSSGLAARAADLDCLTATVGEAVTSIKQPLLLPAYYPTSGGAYNPWYAPSALRDASNQYVKPVHNTMLDHIRRFYAVERGGVVVTFGQKVGQVAANAQWEVAQLGVVESDPATAVGNFNPGVTSSPFQVVEGYNNMPRLVLPRFSPSGGSYNAVGANPYMGGVFFDGYVRAAGGNNTNISVPYVSVADDYMATLFCTTVPMVVPDGLYFR